MAIPLGTVPVHDVGVTCVQKMLANKRPYHLKRRGQRFKRLHDFGEFCLYALSFKAILPHLEDLKIINRPSMFERVQHPPAFIFHRKRPKGKLLQEKVALDVSIPVPPILSHAPRVVLGSADVLTGEILIILQRIDHRRFTIDFHHCPPQYRELLRLWKRLKVGNALHTADLDKIKTIALVFSQEVIHAGRRVAQGTERIDPCISLAVCLMARFTSLVQVRQPTAFNLVEDGIPKGRRGEDLLAIHTPAIRLPLIPAIEFLLKGQALLFFFLLARDPFRFPLLGGFALLLFLLSPALRQIGLITITAYLDALLRVLLLRAAVEAFKVLFDLALLTPFCCGHGSPPGRSRMTPSLVILRLRRESSGF